MATPTFDTIEAQASYGIGLQVGQQLSESGLQGLLPEALVAGIADALEGNQPQVPVEAVHRALREIHERADAVRRERFQSWRQMARNTLMKTASAKALTAPNPACSSAS
ncbi:FKBP-type 22 kDa peptidyl-prolyl cis-trans isomerase [Raoultella terrigena]|uniref:FKBP-type 22 kDa peptidyl-prolyl cis-trans isomerase n=1 Tax=Raoultella terrigena TaxID=577 RepID=A0A4U9D4P6_RAOTE|nr:FKBP-type 22 kDa peptidyl-prolyl cis-trans isomerase [Raoultella terrigena]